MAKISDEFTHTFACPHCSHEITYSLAGLKDDPLLTCSACGKKTQIESGGTLRQTADDLAKLDRAWDKLTKG
jgi:transcription elongation factor Elf1